MLRYFRLHCTPSDRLVLLLLMISVIVAAARLPWASSPGLLEELLGIQLGLLLAFATTVWALVRCEKAWWVRLVRPLATVTVVFTCYTTLGKLGVVAMPYRADAWLSGADIWLFGVNPTFFLESYATPGTVEFFSFFYGAFIPYIYVTIALNCLGQPSGLREEFLTGWVILYFFSYQGYIFLPAGGPVVYHAQAYIAPLSGGFFYGLVVDGVTATGGLQGAFPSLHVGGALYLCLFELRTNRLRGLIFLPLVLMIYAATLVLRYHYVIDLVVGTALAAVCLPLGRAVFGQWVRRRRLAGLPALPGDEANVLPAFSHDGGRDAASVFSAD